MSDNKITASIEVRPGGYTLSVAASSRADVSMTVVGIVDALASGAGREGDPRPQQLEKYFEELLDLLRRSASAGAVLTTVRPSQPEPKGGV